MMEGNYAPLRLIDLMSEAKNYIKDSDRKGKKLNKNYSKMV